VSWLRQADIVSLGFLFQNIDKKLSISEKRIMNRLTVVRTYSGDLAGTPVPACWNSCFIDPGFSGSIKHLSV